MRASWAGLVVLSVVAAAGVARADDKASCLAAHEHGQELRMNGRLLDARALFLTCAQSWCPAPLVRDCSAWSGEVAQDIPSVVVVAKRPDGGDLAEADLYVDGAVLAKTLPATPIALDPGPHVLRLEHAGWSPVEERIVLHVGERERAIRMQFAATAVATTAVPRANGLGGATIAAGAIAAVAGAVSIGFLVAGKTREHELATSACGRAGTCSDEVVGPVRRDYVVAATAAGFAAIALGVAIWQWVAHRPPTTHVALAF